MGQARLRAALLSVLVGLALAALAAAPVGAKTLTWTTREAVAPITSASQLTSRIEALRSRTGKLPPDYTDGQDVRGRTFQQDTAESLLTPATVSRLETLRTQATAQDSAHQKDALAATLSEATALMQQELYRNYLLENYWGAQPKIAEQQRLLEGLQARLPDAERTTAPRSIGLTLEDAGKQITEALAVASPTATEQQANADQVHAALDTVVYAYGEARAALGRTVGISERAHGVAPPSLARTGACPPPATRTSGKPLPTVVPGARASELDYPAIMRRLSIEGAVVVAATISATGCAEKAEVYTPSGAAALDQSALHWALQGQFLPAEQGQQAVEAVMRFVVRFRLED